MSEAEERKGDLLEKMFEAIYDHSISFEQSCKLADLFKEYNEAVFDLHWEACYETHTD